MLLEAVSYTHLDVYKRQHLFSGFLKCADCGKSITRSQSGKNIYYACSTYKNRSRTACSMHSIKHNRLEAAVLFAIQYQVNTAVSYSEMITNINSAPLKKSQSHRLNDQIAAKEKELTRITPVSYTHLDVYKRQKEQTR